jgi:predicted nucleic acid-binding protein
VTPKDVPPGPIMVDTNVFSFIYFKKSGSPWRAFEQLLGGHVLAMSFASLGEALAYGHMRGLGDRRMSDLLARLRTYVIIPFDIAVVQQWAPLHAKLNGHLKKGGANDLWTAACALAADPPLPVATDDLTDFQKIAETSGLKLIHPDL